MFCLTFKKKGILTNKKPTFQKQKQVFKKLLRSKLYLQTSVTKVSQSVHCLIWFGISIINWGNFNEIHQNVVKK